MANEMIERVARAIWGDIGCEFCVNSPNDPLPEDCCCYDAARSTLAAMREPTETMVEAAFPRSYSVRTTWWSMIDAALDE